MFSTDFIFRQQENLVDNQKSQAGYRPLRNKILFPGVQISDPNKAILWFALIGPINWLTVLDFCKKNPVFNKNEHLSHT